MCLMLRMKFMNKVLIVLMSLVLKAFKPKRKFHTICYMKYNI